MAQWLGIIGGVLTFINGLVYLYKRFQKSPYEVEKDIIRSISGAFHKSETTNDTSDVEDIINH